MDLEKVNDSVCMENYGEYYMSVELKITWLGVWVIYVTGEGDVWELRVRFECNGKCGAECIEMVQEKIEEECTSIFWKTVEGEGDSRKYERNERVSEFLMEREGILTKGTE